MGEGTPEPRPLSYFDPEVTSFYRKDFPDVPQKGPRVSFLKARVKSSSSSFWVMEWVGRLTPQGVRGAPGGKAVRNSSLRSLTLTPTLDWKGDPG